MKTILMLQTLPLLYSSQEEVNKLLEEGYELKEIKSKEIKYLVKDEILQTT